MFIVNWLGTPAGCTVILNALVAGGVLGDWRGASWAEDLTLATACVALVRIGRGDIRDLGWCVVALLAMLMTGIVSAFVNQQVGTVIIFTTIAVLFDVIQVRRYQ